ncbi:methyltransferase domain-containing protein [Pelomicrobium sp.]|jgi:arsenite methyltransferase|uniref:methyltransferase domain-containing protein n=1 Tax=Pelomicrobium sp. TaxID=2815319 RepID=UPI002FDDA977
MGTPTFATPVNRVELERKVKEMYQRVALEPTGEFHFEMGRGLALRLGYAPEDLDRIPQEAIDSFAGVGYHFDLAHLQAGEQVLDLGSGSGMDTFVAALKVGPHGRVVGVDMTDAQRAKAERLRDAAGFTQTTYVRGYIEALPVEDEGFDAVISNGVINLSADKPQVFREVARVLRRGGRLALSDILSEKWLPESVTCNATLWAACIGGAMQQEAYFEAMRAAGLRIVRTRENPQYRFLTASAQKACATYGVRSVSLLAVRD